MKKIYCRKCGYKIFDSDTEFCPRCGTRVNDYQEAQKIEKNRRTRKILLIILVIAIIVSVLLVSSEIVMKNNPNEFKRVNLSSTCSLELPNIHFDVQNNSFGGNYGGYSSHTDGKILTSSKLIVSYTKTVDNIGPLSNGGADMNGNLNFGNTKIYSRDVFNYETQETIHIQGEDKELVDRVADSVKFSKGQATNKTNNDSSQQSSNNVNKHALAYKSDGTPMYSQSEVDNYMLSKYGMVNYHIQDNGYISIDDPAYTSDGHRRDNTPTPTPSPTPTNRTAKIVNG